MDDFTHSNIASKKLVEMLSITGGSLLDIGSGMGQHSDYFERNGFEVTAIDIVTPQGCIHPPSHKISFDMFFNSSLCSKYEIVWASHVLEHQRNVGTFLTKCRRVMKESGLLVITVPPFKHNIVGGHLTAWNAGLLLYNLVLAGFDCSRAKVLSYGYNISVMVECPTDFVTIAINDLPLKHDCGDIEIIAPYMPEGCRKQSFNGEIKELNWN